MIMPLISVSIHTISIPTCHDYAAHFCEYSHHINSYMSWLCRSSLWVFTPYQFLHVMIMPLISVSIHTISIPTCHDYAAHFCEYSHHINSYMSWLCRSFLWVFTPYQFLHVMIMPLISVSIHTISIPTCHDYAAHPCEYSHHINSYMSWLCRSFLWVFTPYQFLHVMIMPLIPVSIHTISIPTCHDYAAHFCEYSHHINSYMSWLCRSSVFTPYQFLHVMIMPLIPVSIHTMSIHTISIPTCHDYAAHFCEYSHHINSYMSWLCRSSLWVFTPYQFLHVMIMPLISVSIHTISIPTCHDYAAHPCEYSHHINSYMSWLCRSFLWVFTPYQFLHVMIMPLIPVSIHTISIPTCHDYAAHFLWVFTPYQFLHVMIMPLISVSIHTISIPTCHDYAAHPCEYSHHINSYMSWLCRSSLWVFTPYQFLHVMIMPLIPVSIHTISIPTCHDYAAHFCEYSHHINSYMSWLCRSFLWVFTPYQFLHVMIMPLISVSIHTISIPTCHDYAAYPCEYSHHINSYMSWLCRSFLWVFTPYQFLHVMIMPLIVFTPYQFLHVMIMPLIPHTISIPTCHDYAAHFCEYSHHINSYMSWLCRSSLWVFTPYQFLHVMIMPLIPVSIHTISIPTCHDYAAHPCEYSHHINSYMSWLCRSSLWVFTPYQFLHVMIMPLIPVSIHTISIPTCHDYAAHPCEYSHHINSYMSWLCRSLWVFTPYQFLHVMIMPLISVSIHTISIPTCHDYAAHPCEYSHHINSYMSWLCRSSLWVFTPYQFLHVMIMPLIPVSIHTISIPTCHDYAAHFCEYSHHINSYMSWLCRSFLWVFTPYQFLHVMIMPLIPVSIHTISIPTCHDYAAHSHHINSYMSWLCRSSLWVFTPYQFLHVMIMPHFCEYSHHINSYMSWLCRSSLWVFTPYQFLHVMITYRGSGGGICVSRYVIGVYANGSHHPDPIISAERTGTSPHGSRTILARWRRGRSREDRNIPSQYSQDEAMM